MSAEIPITSEDIANLTRVFPAVLVIAMAALCFFIPWMIFRIHSDMAMVRKLLVAIRENLMTISAKINHAVGPVVAPPGAQPRTPLLPRV